MLKQILVMATGIIIVSCCLPNASCSKLISQLQSCMIEDDLSKPSEVIRIAMFIDYHPAYGSWVSKIIAMDFEDVDGLPLQINSPPFGEGFVRAEIFWMPFGAEGYAIGLIMKFDPSINNETAVEYATTVSEDVMKIMNQADLAIFFKKSFIDNRTNTRTVIIHRGFLPRTLDSVKGLLEYRPQKGFASLITEELLQKLIPGEIDETGVFGKALSELRYMLVKVNNRYQWNFRIQFSIHSALGGEKWIETLDLNSLLLNNEPIQPSPERASEIIVEMPKRHSIPSGIYEVCFEALHPDGVVEKYYEWVRVVYNVTSPIDNVIATIRVERVEAVNGYGQFIIIGLIVIALAFAVILIWKKRRGGEKHVVENANNKYNADSYRHHP